MRAGLMVCGVVLILAGLRCMNVEQDVFTGTAVGLLGTLCIWGSFVISRVEENDEVE